jgi:hypothetical protein
MVKAVGKQTTGQNVELEDAASEALRNVAGYTETETTQGPDTQQTVTTMPESKGSYASVYESLEDVDGGKRNPLTGSVYQSVEDFKKEAEEKPAVGTTTTKNIPGETKTQTYSGTYRQEDTGTELKPWERRWERRSVRSAGRNLRKSMIREARAQARSENLSPKEYLARMKKARQDAKIAETQFELEAAKGQTKAVKAQVQSSAGDGSKFVIGYSDKDIGSLPLSQQKKIGLERQKAAAATNSAAVMTKSGLKKGYFKNK